ncbi:MAG: immunoglobulin domain-containing protein [Verrucomicrobiae bacterium]|nr:immunoglobulin domain-containing protein [Verrucomicrobiae bacterium]
MGVAVAGLATCLLSSAALGQTIPNPSFEANSFAVAPGYVIDNGDITGWTTDFPGGAGLSPAGGDGTFADNGTIPDGSAVAFLAGGGTLATTVTGLTAGTTYKVSLRVNATTARTPILRVTVDSADIMALSVYSVSGTAPYQHVAFEFTAAAATAALGLVNDADGGQTLLMDNLTIAESSGRWTVEPWTDDGTSGVDNQYVYTHAYSFGTGNSSVVNGVPFVGVGGPNPSVAGKFAATRLGNVFNGDANNITGGSRGLATDFIYSGANVNAGEYQSIALEGLTPGTEYVATLFSAGWESPTTSARWATFSVGDDRLTRNQDEFDDNNGIRLSYRYTADASGAVVLNIAPMNPVNVSIHIYGLSNREAVSRNVAPGITVPPTGATVSAGLPVEFSVSASGFPAPTYRWRFNGEDIPGATSSTHTIPAASAADVGEYDVVVSNTLGSVTNDVVRLVVGVPLPNSSFEVDSFLSWPGYSGDNPGNASTPPGPNVPITGWLQSAPENSGINPIENGESPFADNGRIPHGRQVAFLQSLDVPVTFGRAVEGLTVGAQYYLHYYENARAASGTPALEVSLGGTVLVPEHTVPSGGYREVFSDVFAASATSLDLVFTKSSPGGGDTTALIDNVAVVPVPANTAPFIARSPSGAAAYVGGSATLSAQVLGSLPLSYQWFRDGVPVPQGTGPALVLTDLQKPAEGNYTLQVTNIAGAVTTTAVPLAVNRRVPGLFNTGVDDTHASLPDGETDTHYELIVNPHIESTAAIVQDSTVFPIVSGPWLLNTATSKWIGPEFNTVAGAVGLYTYRTELDLTGLDPRSVVIRGQWACDNAGRDILVNGVSTGNPQSPGFGAYTPFAIEGTEVAFTAGVNTLDFIVENVDAIGYTGLRVEILTSNADPAGSRMEISRSGDTVTLTWTSTGAGPRLQSAPDLDGPWTDVTGATSPYVTTPATSPLFFQLVP